MQDLRWDLSQALELTGVQNREVWKPFWGTQQRFFKLLCISMKACALFVFVREPCSHLSTIVPLNPQSAAFFNNQILYGTRIKQCYTREGSMPVVKKECL